MKSITIQDVPNVISKEFEGEQTWNWNNVVPSYTEKFTLKVETNKEGKSKYEVIWHKNLEGLCDSGLFKEEFEQQIIDVYKKCYLKI